MGYLLLRGLSRQAGHWGPFPRLLEEATGERVVTLDLPGAGTEHRRPSPPSMRGIADDVRARFLDRHGGGGEPFRLLGISLGGMVAMQWCGDHPEDFAGVVLANTSAADLSPPWRRMDLGALLQIARALVERDDEARERRILGFTTRVVTDFDGPARHNAALQQEQPMARRAVLSQIVAAGRFRAPPRLALPALVLAAARDPLAHPDCGRRLADHFGAAFRIHPTAGHDLSLDDGPWLARTIAQWARG